VAPVIFVAGVLPTPGNPTGGKDRRRYAWLGTAVMRDKKVKNYWNGGHS